MSKADEINNELIVREILHNKSTRELLDIVNPTKYPLYSAPFVAWAKKELEFRACETPLECGCRDLWKKFKGEKSRKGVVLNAVGLDVVRTTGAERARRHAGGKP